MVGQVVFTILCGGVISSTAIARGTGRNPTRTVHPFHGWIFQFRGIFVARVGQFERTKEAVDLGGNWPSLSNNSWGEDENFATHASRSAPWVLLVAGTDKWISRKYPSSPSRCRGYSDFSLPFKTVPGRPFVDVIDCPFIACFKCF